MPSNLTGKHILVKGALAVVSTGLVLWPNGFAEHRDGRVDVNGAERLA